MQQRIQNYVRAGYPGVYLLTHEEQRAEAELMAVAQATGYHLYVWSLTTGTIDTSNGKQVAQDSADALAPLQTFLEHTVNAGIPSGKLIPDKSIMVLRDYHQFLSGEAMPIITRTMKDALVLAKSTNRLLVVMGCRLCIPPELAKEITLVEFGLPSREQLKLVLEGIAKSASIVLNGNTDALLDAASGLTCQEAENAFALSVAEAGKLCPEVVAREKANTIKKNGILEVEETPKKLGDVGGLDELKGWIIRRRLAFSKKARDYGLPVPRGVLILGCPGTGKSLTASAISSLLNCPQIRFDVGAVMGGLVGESEANMRAVIQTAEAVAPCVLLCEELEKGFAGTQSSGQTDGGTTARVFGTFLNWLQEKTAPVFVVATANDVSKLPPELLRKGRFDELFFVDLPDQGERESIWKIQIKKYGRDPEKYDIIGLAKMSDGWTGSEIESVFQESLYAAFERDTEPDDLTVADIAKDLVPLSKTRAEELNALRKWAEGRARKASGTNEPALLTRKLAV